MKKLIFTALLILFTRTVFAASWAYGTIDIVESYSDKILIRWDGPKTENCASNAVVVTALSLGSKDALDRAFKLSLTSAVSGKPIRFKLEGCNSNYQKAVVVQLCAKSKCPY